jgi:RNA polymerase sigma-70 factor (ECF subfamily)
LQDRDDASSSGDNLDGWVLSTWSRALAYAQSLLRHRPGAEDIVQDCYCNLLRRADVYDLLRDGVPLLMKSITNACLKKLARDRPMISLNLLSSVEEEGWQGFDPVHPNAVEPANIVLNAELQQAIEKALARLSDTQRAAIELKGLGHSLGEIASILDVSAANAGVLVFRARQAMAKYLAPYLEGRTG